MVSRVRKSRLYRQNLRKRPLPFKRSDNKLGYKIPRIKYAPTRKPGYNRIKIPSISSGFDCFDKLQERQN